MTVTIKLNTEDIEQLKAALEQTANIETELKKNYPDVVMNVEVEIG
jgi:hypothetical protein